MFGKTPALINLSEQLKADVIVDPYGGIDMDFNSETEAYSHFIKNVGLDAYLAKLLNVIETEASICTLIGFSVGASIVWKISEQVSSNSVKQAVCYYGSQIRHFSDLKPRFKIELVFPKSEPGFNVSALQAELAKKHNVKAYNVDYLHGFMNYHSNNYNHSAYQEQIRRLNKS